MFKTVVALVALAMVPAASNAAPQPTVGWKALADCAAAYRANSQVQDPDRAPSMKAMIADQSKDYETNATRRYRHETKASAASARRSVDAYVASRFQDFSKQPRADIEQFIDACPQAEG